MALSANAETIAAVGSHSVNGRGARIEKEEAFPVLPIYWRGQIVRVQFEANRSTSSDGDWSPWRTFARDARADDGTNHGPSVGMSDTMRRAVTDAGTPLVLAWLNGETETETGRTYAESRADAFRYFVTHKMTYERPSEYAIRDARQALETHAHELTEPVRAILTEALAHLESFQQTINKLD